MNEVVAQTQVQEYGDFHVLVQRLQAHADQKISNAQGQVFICKYQDAECDSKSHAIFDTYLNGFSDPVARQHHNCNICKNFLRRYGHLVVINPQTLQTESVFWNEDIVDEHFYQSIKNMRLLVEALPIESVFYYGAEARHSNYDNLGMGVKEAGGFNHFHFHIESKLQAKRDRTQTAVQAMAEAKEDFRLLQNTVVRTTREPFQNALKQLISLFTYDEQLSKVEHHRNMLIWFDALATDFRERKKDGNATTGSKQHLIWLAVATEPKGRLRLGQGVLDEFLRNLLSGESVDVAKRKYLAQVDPLTYMRAQAPASEGNIREAERIVDELGIKESLKRRNATIQDIPDAAYVWKKSQADENTVTEEKGVFDHLLNDKNTPKNTHVIDGGIITWNTFVRTKLPEAEELYVVLQPTTRYNIAGYVTATNMDAPPIFRHDTLADRNPVSCYVYHNGSFLNQWALKSTTGLFAVTGVVRSPYVWTKELGDEESLTLLFDHGFDQVSKCLAIFPELLIPELHKVRATIEMFSQKGDRDNTDTGLCGLVVAKNSGHLEVRIKSKGNMIAYKILTVQ